MEIFQWLNNQLLKMEWLSDLIRKLVENGLNLDMSTRLGGSIQFFIYDVIKIFILLAVLFFTISYIQSFFPPERTGPSLVNTRASGPISLARCWVPLPRFVPVRPFLIYWFYQRRIADWGDFFFFGIISSGRSGFGAAAGQHF